MHGQNHIKLPWLRFFIEGLIISQVVKQVAVCFGRECSLLYFGYFDLARRITVRLTLRKWWWVCGFD